MCWRVPLSQCLHKVLLGRRTLQVTQRVARQSKRASQRAPHLIDANNCARTVRCRTKVHIPSRVFIYIHLDCGWAAQSLLWNFAADAQVSGRTPKVAGSRVDAYTAAGKLRFAKQRHHTARANLFFSRAAARLERLQNYLTAFVLAKRRRRRWSKFPDSIFVSRRFKTSFPMQITLRMRQLSDAFCLLSTRASLLSNCFAKINLLQARMSRFCRLDCSFCSLTKRLFLIYLPANVVILNRSCFWSKPKVVPGNSI